MNLLPRNPQAGYIGLTLVAFLIVLSAVLYPFKLPRIDADGCRVGQPGDKTILMPPIVNVGARRGVPGGWDESAPKTEFVQIRKNVPIFMNSDDPNYDLGYPGWMGRDGEIPEGLTVRWPVIADTEYLGAQADTRHTLEYKNANQAGFDVYYPNMTGEVELPFRTTDRAGLDLTITNPNQSILTLRTEGFLLFVHLDPSGEPIKINYGPHIYYLVDFYQDKAMYEAPDSVKGYNVEDIFHCLDPDSPAHAEVVVPEQNVSELKDQLQLEWFVLKGQPGMYAHCKPAVYLYPEERKLVNVKVYPKGELSYTDPPYDKEKGWTVWSEPNGGLYQVSGTKYQAIKNGYLYYESKIYDSEIKKPTKGWVVKPSELEKLFNEKLLLLGLNEKEAKDFKDYWLTKLPDSPYYFVGLVDKSQRDYLERLDVTPDPDTSIRFSFFFEMLDQPKEVEEPVITAPKRKGFTLVDWGGMVKLHKNTAFTCSQ